MPGWLTEELGGFALWQVVLMALGTFAAGYLRTKHGGRE